MDQIAKGEKITIDPNGPPPEIKIVIGNAQIGFYSAYLIKGDSHPLICKGKSSDPPKWCPIGRSSAALPGQFVSWQVRIAATPPGSPIVLTVTLRQAATNLKTYTYHGNGDDLTVDYVTLA